MCVHISSHSLFDCLVFLNFYSVFLLTMEIIQILTIDIYIRCLDCIVNVILNCNFAATIRSGGHSTVASPMISFHIREREWGSSCSSWNPDELIKTCSFHNLFLRYNCAESSTYYTDHVPDKFQIVYNSSWFKQQFFVYAIWSDWS